MTREIRKEHKIKCDKPNCEEEISKMFNKDELENYKKITWLTRLKEKGWNIGLDNHTCPKCVTRNALHSKINMELQKTIVDETDNELAQKMNEKITKLTNQQLKDGVAKEEVNIHLFLEMILSLKIKSDDNIEFYSDLFDITIEEVTLLEPGAERTEQKENELVIHFPLKAPWGYEVDVSKTKEIVIKELKNYIQYESEWWKTWNQEVQEMVERIIDEEPNTNNQGKDNKAEKKTYGTCLECEDPIELKTDIQLCQECMKKFDVEKLWNLHDKDRLDALDFNENKSMRERFRKETDKTSEEHKITAHWLRIELEETDTEDLLDHSKIIYNEPLENMMDEAKYECTCGKEFESYEEAKTHKNETKNN